MTVYKQYKPNIRRRWWLPYRTEGCTGKLFRISEGISCHENISPTAACLRDSASARCSVLVLDADSDTFVAGGGLALPGEAAPGEGITWLLLLVRLDRLSRRLRPLSHFVTFSSSFLTPHSSACPFSWDLSLLFVLFLLVGAGLLTRFNSSAKECLVIRRAGNSSSLSSSFLTGFGDILGTLAGGSVGDFARKRVLRGERHLVSSAEPFFWQLFGGLQ